MLVYLDTSALIPYLVQEDSSSRISALLQKTPELCLSRWTQTEFISALARKVRMKECSNAGFAAAVQQLEVLIAQHLICISPVPEDFLQASRYLQAPMLGLRAGDALHLAMAARLKARLLTLDQGLAKAARHFKVSVKMP